MKTQGLTDHQAAAWDRYQRMRVRLSERLNREISRETGLSEADFEILSVLAESPDETVRALELRCGLEWEKSRLSHQLRRMEQRGLVRREHCSEDNRGSVIRITETGRERAAEARLIYEQAVQRYVCDALTPEQIDALDAISRAVLANLEEPHKS